MYEYSLTETLISHSCSEGENPATPDPEAGKLEGGVAERTTLIDKPSQQYVQVGIHLNMETY